MAFIAAITLYPNNTQWIEIDGLADGLSPTTYKNAATVVCTLFDPSGAAVAGVTGLSLAYVGSSNGVYRGLVPSTFNPQVGPPYRLRISITDAGGNVGTIDVPCAVATRTS